MVHRRRRRTTPSDCWPGRRLSCSMQFTRARRWLVFLTTSHDEPYTPMRPWYSSILAGCQRYSATQIASLSRPLNPLVMPKLVAPTAPNAAHVHVTWAGGLRFDAGPPAGPVARIDGSAETGQGPLDAILSALAICAATDILEILEKRRTPAGRFTADVVGERVETVPRRLRQIDLHYTIDGPDIDRGHAERAVDLALTKYCSVRGSLDPAIPITFVVTLNNERGIQRQAGEWRRGERRGRFRRVQCVIRSDRGARAMRR